MLIINVNPEKIMEENTMRKFSLLAPLLLMVCLLVAVPAFAATENSTTPSSTSSGPSSNISTEQLQSANQLHGVSVSDLIGKTVENKKGETLGVVKDVVIGSDGIADFVIIAHGGFGGFVNVDQKYVPVPYQTFMSNMTNLAKIDTDSDIIANLDKSQLDKAPTFSKMDWNSMKASQDKICSYYGQGQCPRRCTQG